MLHNNDHLYIFATIKPKPEFFDQAKAALEELVPLTLAEPGCHLFTVLENRDEPGSLHLFEIFSDKAAMQAHHAKKYTKDVFAKYQKWLAAEIDIQYLSVTSALSSGQFQ